MKKTDISNIFKEIKPELITKQRIEEELKKTEKENFYIWNKAGPYIICTTKKDRDYTTDIVPPHNPISFERTTTNTPKQAVRTHLAILDYLEKPRGN